jgi:outer membrane protein TolC
MDTTREAVAAARTTFSATEARWLAGAVSLFELEDARRQLAGAEDSAIAARRDRAQAWVALIKASGNSAAATTFNLVPQPDLLHADAFH